jgi:hypothetical protein
LVDSVKAVTSYVTKANGPEVVAAVDWIGARRSAPSMKLQPALEKTVSEAI